jgi:hypothetical protein
MPLDLLGGRGRGGRRFGMASAGIGGSKFGNEDGSGGGEDAAEKEERRQRFEAAFRRVNGHGHQGIDDGGAAENDRHDSGGGRAFVDGCGGAERQHQSEGAECAGDTGDQAPGHAVTGEAPVGPSELEQKGGSNADQSIGNANEQKRFQAGMRGFRPHGHEAAALVEEDAINAPGEHGEKGKNDPIHITHVIKGGRITGENAGRNRLKVTCNRSVVVA